MIRLYQFPPAFGLPNASPFCMKVETYLRMAGLPYENVYVPSPMKAPKGKLPYIEDGAETVADSGFAIDYLKQRYGDSLDAWLSAESRAVALAFRRLMEENLYWAVLYSRWFDEPGWSATKAAFFGKLPPLMREIVPSLAQRSMRKELWGHGIGRHRREEIYDIGKRDIAAVADFLADKPYFIGEKTSSVDATAYAFFANLLWVPVSSPLQTAARERPNLDAYCRRMQAAYFPRGEG